jgi:ligand-binding sensor domain-containing protein/serine phosphatase RsbU (regulator of sigma subunit)
MGMENARNSSGVPRRPSRVIVCTALLAAAVVTAGAPSALMAQEEAVIFERLSIEQGLSQSIVESIIQDRRGFMWFGTQDGLNKYDGYQFTVKRQDPRDANSLSHNNILSLCEDHTGLIWIGTFNGGLNSYDPSTERFTLYTADVNDPNSLSNNLVRVIFEDHQGSLWVGTGDGLNRFDRATGRFTQYKNDPNDAGSLSHNFVRKICEDGSGFLWIGTNDGLNRFDTAAGTFKRYRNVPGNPKSLSNDAIRALYVDREGVLWVGTEGGLNRFDAQRDAFTRYRAVPGDPNSLSNNAVYSIYEDTRSVLWIGTNGGGLNRFDRKTSRFHSYRNDPFNPLTLSYDEIYALYEDRSGVLWIGTWGGGVDKVDTKRKEFALYRRDPNNPNSLSHDIVWSIYEDESGILWIGTHGGGLNRFDRRTNRFTHYRHDPHNPNSLSNDVVRIILEDRSGIFWLGTNGGGISRFDRKTGRFTTYRNDPGNPHSLSHDEIRCMFQDQYGTIWIGTNGGGLNAFDPKTGIFTRYRNDPRDTSSLSDNYVRVVYEDRAGELWVGTQGDGLNKFDRKTGKCIRFRANPSDPRAINNDYIMSILESKSGAMWIATWGGGLSRFDRSDGSFKSYGEENGLAGNAVYGILEDAAGNLWLSSNNGLSRFNPNTETFKNYGVQDGLQSKEFDALAYFESRSGEMFFGGINGFNAFFPENIRDNPYIPPVVITSFTKLNREATLDSLISEMKELKLSYRDYVFSFEFAALDYTAPLKNLYAYKMDGLDREWVYTNANKRFANYTTLPAGKYTFRVKGSNNDGVWNEAGFSIGITITPPFWGTWWFRAAVILIVVMLAILWYQRRLRTVRMTAELLAARDAQMSIMPHADPSVEGFDISGVCIPASEVGGDFFDYFWLNDSKTRFGIAIGDVSGKAMKAAMIAVMSNGMIATKANESFSPGEALTGLNRPLYSKTGEEIYTALWLAALDVREKTFTYSNAGFLDPLLITERKVRMIESSGPRLPLGALQDTKYEEGSIRFGAGDVMVLFTDGITEARNGEKEFYNYSSLRKLLEGIDTSAMSAKEIKARIIDDVKRFVGSAPQFDDMTVVVVKAL